jgi:hypothetical protein
MMLVLLRVMRSGGGGGACVQGVDHYCKCIAVGRLCKLHGAH